MITRKMDRRTALKIKDAATVCSCGYVFTSNTAKNIVNDEIVCTNCAMAHDYAKAAKTGKYYLFN